VLEADIAALSDPWDQLERIITGALAGYEADAQIPGRLWIESWHSAIHDPEMRADTLRDYGAWRRLVADTVRRGIERGSFGAAHPAEMVAVLAIALVDGVGIPLALSDPEVTVPGAIRDVLAALRELLRPRLRVTAPNPAAAAEGVGGQRSVDRAHQRCEPVVLAGGEQPAGLLEGLHAGEGPESLDRAEDVKQSGYGLVQLLDGPLLGTGQDQLDGRLLQAGPGICPELPQAVVRH
jgi:hypothetical protein